MAHDERPRSAPASRDSTSTPAGRLGKARAYARLAKLDIIDYYLGLLVAWSLLAPVARAEPAVWAALALLLAGELCMVAAMTSFDDVTGLRDGSDAANYGPDAPRRKLVRKPLIAGTLGESEAVRFGWSAAAAAALLWAGAVAVAPHRPLWAVAALALCLVCAVQYSWGLKLSYHGWQEVFLVALGVGLLAGPYGLFAGTIDAFVLTQGLLFGLGPLLFGVYSNTNDIPGDAKVRRRTVAVLTSARGNAAFVAAVSAAEAVLIAAAVLTGIAPWWFAPAMAPVVLLRATQWTIGFVRGDILRARNLGIAIHRVTVALLIAVNLVYPLHPGGVH
ncbi:UbiA family prenyltransferase [Streptomonospora litoralis]|uniref:1,4-dihydroxy-2-naphthoate octaprenyltransferase n=1 Tax=Streptomonospora litoralis TaxID=2498135 RepID=A0A4P6Q497_9ACTN|nr:UbiA family prenyltransferase [Streptomonospora litoralis]QBI55528.1 1,4-dihydroxy-2-naphthoate octaprenyltransferase [Streptomonospora litoralis]